MGRISQKEKNRRKGSLMHPVVENAPVIVQSNEVIRAEKITPKRNRKKEAEQKKKKDV